MRRIVTSSSTYVVDDETERFMRLPGVGHVDETWTVSDLFGDGEWLELAGPVEPVVGERLILWHVQDGRETWRVTTPVVSVETS